MHHSSLLQQSRVLQVCCSRFLRTHFQPNEIWPRQQYHQILFSAFNIKTLGFKHKNFRTKKHANLIRGKVLQLFFFSSFTCNWFDTTKQFLTIASREDFRISYIQGKHNLGKHVTVLFNCPNTGEISLHQIRMTCIFLTQFCRDSSSNTYKI